MSDATTQTESTCNESICNEIICNESICNESICKENTCYEGTDENITESINESVIECSKESILHKEENKVIEKIPEKPTDFDTLVLSGASSKGFLLLGSLQYILDNHLHYKISNYIGTSVGAMIGYLLAIGYTPIEIMVYVCTHRLLERIQNLNLVAMINGNGASSYTSIQEQLEKMTIEKIGYLPTLGNLKTKFGKSLTCVTFNLTIEKIEYISSESHPDIPCLVALRMSANLPFVFNNFKYNNSMYIDGGICDNFSIDIGEKIGNKVLGIYVSPDKDGEVNYNDLGVIEYIYRLMFIPISQATQAKIQSVNINTKIIRLQTDTIRFFDFDLSGQQKMQLFSDGYQQTKISFENE